MMLKYKYQETKEIKKLLLELEALKTVFERIKAGETRGATYKAKKKGE